MELDGVSTTWNYDSDMTIISETLESVRKSIDMSLTRQSCDFNLQTANYEFCELCT